MHARQQAQYFVRDIPAAKVPSPILNAEVLPHRESNEVIFKGLT